jgi:hypothetical protein
MTDAAQAYAARDWPVFPCEARGKRPEGRLVPHGLKDASTNPEQIARWWTAAPEANIGLVTGIAFDVLDVDGFEGWRSLARMVDEFGTLASSPVSMTPNGGAHYFFLPTGQRNRAGFRPNLDWRGAAGYIVAPPSVGANGTPYEWAVDPDEQPLEPAPSWLVGLLTERKVASAPKAVAPSTRSTRYGRAALESEVGRLLLSAEGQRNDALNASAFALGQLIARRDLDVDDVIDALLLAAERIGLGVREARATIASGLKSGAACPRRMVP